MPDSGSVATDSIRNHLSPDSPPFDNLLADHQYVWRARAYDGWEHGPWSDLQTFRTQSGSRVVAVPAEFTSIQVALDVLSTGDTIKLSPGIDGGGGNRELNFYGKQIVVMSSAGAQWTTVDLGGSAGDWSRLLPADYRPERAPIFRDLTISGGYADSGGVVKDSDVRFEDCVLKENRADYGAIACGMNGTVSLVGSRIENNVATESGGVFFSRKGSRRIVSSRPIRRFQGALRHKAMACDSGCTFEANIADQGSCFYYDDADLSYCLLLENGPGSMARYGPFHFDHCTIVRNAGVVSWVGYYWGEGATFTNCLIADNDSYVNQCELDPDLDSTREPRWRPSATSMVIAATIRDVSPTTPQDRGNCRLIRSFAMRTTTTSISGGLTLSGCGRERYEYRRIWGRLHAHRCC